MNTNQDEIREDAVDYSEALMKNDVDACLEIERRYHLDGYPPGVVIMALQARNSRTKHGGFSGQINELINHVTSAPSRYTKGIHFDE